MKPTHTIATAPKRAALAGAAALALSAAGAARAAPIPVTFDPGAFASGAQAFTADKLNLLNFARVDLGATAGGQTAFTETGVLQVNNASLASATFDPAGNRSGYSLYLTFSGSGTQSAPNFTGGSQGTFSSLTYTLVGSTGAARFGIDGSNNPFVVPGGATTTLATGSLIQGTSTFSASPLGAGANVDATFVQRLAGFVASPADAALTLSGAFNNNSNIVTVFNGGASFALNGGGGDLSFAAPAAPVPEPAGLALLGVGLVGLGLVGRRRKPD